MDIKIYPHKLCGAVDVPPSKSISHRALICAALSKGDCKISNLLDCADTRATIGALEALDAKIAFNGTNAEIHGIENPTKAAEINCLESGSTLRFIIPVLAALGVEATLSGSGKLPERPITPYIDELSKKGIVFSEKQMPYRFSGQLHGGEFNIRGDISSQFITGLLLALPLLAEDSIINLTSPLQSKPYVDITIDVMKSFGVDIKQFGESYLIHGGAHYESVDFSVEPDMSQAAFFLVGKAIGNEITLPILNENSVQGDKKIIDIVKHFNIGNEPFNVSGEQIPDLVPILSVLASFGNGRSKITDCARLRIKESDRLAAVADELNRLGGRVEIIGDSLAINGVKSLHGGVCDSHNDHRIAMMLTIASSRSDAPIVIKNAGCVAKSYPRFFEDFKKLGGVFDVI